jgi:hypothetical protein
MLREAGLISTIADQPVHGPQTLSERTGSIAHDLNNMLGTMLCYGCLVLEDMPADDPNRPALEKIVEAGLEAKRLVAALSNEAAESTWPTTERSARAA